MRKLLFTLCLLLPIKSFALDAQVKGFIALDVLNYEKIQKKDGAAVIGIGVLDLKIFAEQDNMTAAMKLDLDNSNLGKKNSIFEEAYASYRGIKNWRFTLGKSVVKFQNLHWGAIENTYLDGGSILDTENGWRKVSRKALVSAGYGSRSLGFNNIFTFWGDSSEIRQDEKGNPVLVVGSGNCTPSTSPCKVTGYTVDEVPSFSTSKQIGLANKFEYYTGPWTFTAGQIFYKNKFQPKNSYGVDFGATKESQDVEYWADLMYGVSSKAPFESYNTFRKEEYFVQLGTQYYLNEIWSIIGNAEFTHVKDLAHNYTVFEVDGKYYQGDQSSKFGQTVKTTNYKIESAAQYRLSKSAFVTMGGLYERKLAALNGVKGLSFIKGVNNPNCEAFKFATTVSFWF